jgi:hypothetical protein
VFGFPVGGRHLWHAKPVEKARLLTTDLTP